MAISRENTLIGTHKKPESAVDKKITTPNKKRYASIAADVCLYTVAFSAIIASYLHNRSNPEVGSAARTNFSDSDPDTYDREKARAKIDALVDMYRTQAYVIDVLEAKRHTLIRCGIPLNEPNMLELQQRIESHYESIIDLEAKFTQFRRFAIDVNFISEITPNDIEYLAQRAEHDEVALRIIPHIESDKATLERCRRSIVSIEQ